MQVYKKTDIGLRRTSNQDFCDSGELPGEAVWLVVCDGMGGANGGNIASELAVQVVSEQLENNYLETMKDAQIEEMMLSAIFSANACIYNAAREQESLHGMGTTIVLAIIKGTDLYLAHVGDSRAYLIQEQRAHQVTVDHSMVQELVSKGDLTPQEAKHHPQKNIITRALGVRAQVETAYQKLEFGKDDVLLLCTDGLSSYVEPEDIYALYQAHGTEQLTEKLVEVALDGGGSDNITVLVAQNDRS